MLPLRERFRNEDLIHMLHGCWLTDAQQDLLGEFSADDSARVPIRRGGRVCVLRFAPESHRDLESVQAEAALVHYLRERDFPAPAWIPTLEGGWAERVETPFGVYVAAMMERVKPKTWAASAASARALGETLGFLHALSSEYVGPRLHTHEDVLDFCERTCAGEPESVRLRIESARAELSTWVRTPKTYGWIHGGFTPDVVGEGGIVDRFDACRLDFFVCDVASAVMAMDAALTPAFLEGYQRRFPLDEAFFSHQAPYLRRYLASIRHARLLRATVGEGPWRNEPGWLTELRAGCLRAIEEERRTG